jgi:two-component system chemotaxis sensor kinase CheA
VSQFQDERGAELRQLFFESAREILQSLNDEALQLEKHPGDEEVIRSIRRHVHTLKGDAAAVGFRELSELAHELEDALALDAVKAHIPLADIAFTAADLFAAMLDSYSKNSKLPSSAPLKKLVAELALAPKAAKTRKKKPAATATVADNCWTEYEKLSIHEASARGKFVYHIRAQVDPACAMPIAARQLVVNALAESGELLASRPEPGSTASVKELQALLASDRTGEQITQKCRIPTVISQVTVETLAKPSSQPEKSKDLAPAKSADQANRTQNLPSAAPEAPQPAPPAEDENAKNSHTPETTLRVDAERIDNVLNLVGELIIGKSMLQQALNEFAAQSPKDPMRARFADAMSFQARVLNDLQRAVMKVRMVPVEQLFRRFPRMVRDVAKQCGKEVEIALHGQDTDLDKSLLDAIAEPITHLVRNAVGHGIESPEDRIRHGKPAKGTIHLDAFHQANQVIIQIGDDGGGIDTQKVKSRAVERGLLSSDSATRLNDNDVLDLIFRPGFSTADEITEIAGRGVGLDVVQSVLHRLKGTVEVETQLGKGTRFQLRMPLTLAIIKALLFRVEDRTYALPLNAVAEIARARESDLHQVDHREVLQLRNYVLPVVRLGRSNRARPGDRDARIFILVIAVGERKFGLLVDSLNGEEELVIKPLNDQTVETDLVSGASILGDGRVVLIVNLAAIVERFTRLGPDASHRPGFGLLLSQSEKTQESSTNEVRQ